MANDDTLDRAFNVRMNSQELDRIEAIRERIQARLGPGVRVTQRTALMEMLERTEAYYAKLDKDRDRER